MSVRTVSTLFYEPVQWDEVSVHWKWNIGEHLKSKGQAGDLSEALDAIRETMEADFGEEVDVHEIVEQLKSAAENDKKLLCPMRRAQSPTINAPPPDNLHTRTLP